MCCSVLQCVAACCCLAHLEAPQQCVVCCSVCCSVLRCVLKCIATRGCLAHLKAPLQFVECFGVYFSVCCSVSHSVLQYVAVCSSACCRTTSLVSHGTEFSVQVDMDRSASDEPLNSTLQNIAAHCNTL